MSIVLWDITYTGFIQENLFKLMSCESYFYLDIQVFATNSQADSVLLFKMLSAKVVALQFPFFF